MIDLDASLYIEYDNGTKEPLALIETAVDVGQDIKPATVTKRLAARAGLPAFTVLYTLAATRLEADPSWYDISGFRVKQLVPHESKAWQSFSPQAWREFLYGLRQECCRPLDEAFRARPMNGKVATVVGDCYACGRRIPIDALKAGLCEDCRQEGRRR